MIFGLEPSPTCKILLQQKDLQRIEKADYNASEHYKYLSKIVMAKEKGQKEGVVYSSRSFDVPDLQQGPSKRQKKD